MKYTSLKESISTSTIELNDSVQITPMKGYDIYCSDPYDVDEILNLLFDYVDENKIEIIRGKKGRNAATVLTYAEIESKKMTNFFQALKNDQGKTTSITFKKLA